jgi:PKD repeat protein
VTARDGSGNTASDEAPFVINRPPVAAAVTPAPAFRNEVVSFDGSTSNDPDGDALTYQWDFGDGATATGPSPTHAFSTMGSHAATLVVNDGITASSPITVTVTIVNQAPTAYSGGPYAAVRHQSISFDGSASADADGDALTYLWDFGDGVTATGARPTHAFSTLGAHTVTLVVNDGHDTSAPVTAAVTITNQTPTANAGGPYTAVRNQSVVFDGSASADADGDALTYQWDFGDGATATEASPTHAFTDPGRAHRHLVVSDGHDTSAPATATVTITNQAPTANAGGPYTAVRNQARRVRWLRVRGRGRRCARLPVGLSATVSPRRVPAPTHVFSTLGAHTVTLVVSDGHDTSAPATATVTITNQTPTASAAGPYSAVRNQSIVFDGSASADADGDALSYQWDFGDGATATGANPTHAFTTLGSHTVTLIVNDGHDSSPAATATVTITNQAPTAHAGGPYTAVRNQVIAFDGAASADTDGDALTYQWDFGDGATASGASPTHAFTTLGSHTVTLIVNDGHDSSPAATATVSIANQAPTANAGGPYTAVRNQAIVFNGAASADTDGDALTYQWDFGDGATATGASPPMRSRRWDRTRSRWS